ncbi:MAG: hypothetical protein WDM77_08985 [Steroidobacteraceae bacterium]
MSGISQALILATAIAAIAGVSVARAAEQSSAPDTSVEGSAPLQEVTVTATHLQLDKRIAKFVSQIAASENGDGLPRWKVHVCPRVIGLPRQEGEFVLERLSEVAIAAGAPLAGEQCRPNLYIAVTTDPMRLLNAMSLQSQELTYGGANPSRITAFITTPRVVRVWYKTSI